MLANKVYLWLNIHGQKIIKSWGRELARNPRQPAYGCKVVLLTAIRESKTNINSTPSLRRLF